MIGKFQFFPKEMGNYFYINLIYWLMEVCNVFQTAESTTKALSGFSLLVLFLLVFRESTWAKSKQRQIKLLVCLILQVAITCVMIVCFNEYFLYMTFFSGMLASSLPSTKRTSWFLVGMLVAVTAAAGVMQGGLTWGDLVSLIPFYLANFTLPLGFRAFQRWRLVSKDLQAANAQIEHLTKQAERQRIARDLHDTLGHALSMITLKSELAEKLVPRDPVRASQEMRDVQNASRAALAAVRELVANMQTVSLPDELLNIRRILDAADVTLHVHGSLDEQGLNTSTSSILALCLREAVTNIVRHSRAKTCTVTLQTTPYATNLRIADDGRGWQEKGDGNGLLGMRQRVDVVGGTVQCETEPGGGAALVITLPHILSGKKGD